MIVVSSRDRPVVEKLGLELMAAFLRVNFDSSYPTNGEPLDLPKITGINNILHVRVENKSGYIFDYDRANKKLLAYSSGATQVGNGTDLSTLTNVGIMVVGKG